MTKIQGVVKEFACFTAPQNAGGIPAFLMRSWSLLPFILQKFRWIFLWILPWIYPQSSGCSKTRSEFLNTPFSLFLRPCEPPVLPKKGNTRKRTVCSCREQTIFFLIRDIPISDCRNLAESFVIYMCIAIFRFKGGRAYFFMVGEKFYKQIFLAVTQFF